MLDNKVGRGLVKISVQIPVEICPECEAFSKKIRPLETLLGWISFLAFFAAFYGMVYAMQNKNLLIGIISFGYVFYTMAESMLWKKNYLTQLILKAINGITLDKSRPAGYYFNHAEAFQLDANGFIHFYNDEFNSNFFRQNPSFARPAKK